MSSRKRHRDLKATLEVWLQALIRRQSATPKLDSTSFDSQASAVGSRQPRLPAVGESRGWGIRIWNRNTVSFPFVQWTKNEALVNSELETLWTLSRSLIESSLQCPRAQAFLNTHSVGVKCTESLDRQREARRPMSIYARQSALKTDKSMQFQQRGKQVFLKAHILFHWLLAIRAEDFSSASF